MSSYQLLCTCVPSKWKPKNEIFMCDFIFFLKNKIRAIFELEYYICVAFSLLFSLSIEIVSILYPSLNPFPNNNFKLIQTKRVCRRQFQI